MLQSTSDLADRSSSARMSSTRHAVTRGPSFTGLGKRPDFTPSHQVRQETGKMGGTGGVASRSPMMVLSRTKPVEGNKVEVVIEAYLTAHPSLRCAANISLPISRRGGGFLTQLSPWVKRNATAGVCSCVRYLIFLAQKIAPTRRDGLPT